MEKLTLYDYLGFIVPGGLVLATIVYGFDLASFREAPASTGMVLLAAAAFVIGHLNAAIANYLQSAAWGKKPGTRLPSSTGLFGKRGLHEEPAQQGIEQDFERQFPQGQDFQQRFDLGYTLLRQKKLDTSAQIMNQQLGFYRNTSASVLVSLLIVTVAAFTGHNTLDWWLWLPVGLVAEALLIFRFRRFWVRFGNEIIRGVQAYQSAPSGSEESPPT